MPGLKPGPCLWQQQRRARKGVSKKAQFCCYSALQDTICGHLWLWPHLRLVLARLPGLPRSQPPPPPAPRCRPQLIGIAAAPTPLHSASSANNAKPFLLFASQPGKVNLRPNCVLLSDWNSSGLDSPNVGCHQMPLHRAMPVPRHQRGCRAKQQMKSVHQLGLNLLNVP